MSQTPSPTAHPVAPPLSESDERLWATLVHLGGILFYFLPAMVGYLTLKNRGAFSGQHGTAALNFQLTVLVGYVVGFFTAWFLVGFLVLLAVAVANVLFCILAAVEANRGRAYVYPVAIPFIKA